MFGIDGVYTYYYNGNDNNYIERLAYLNYKLMLDATAKKSLEGKTPIDCGNGITLYQ